MTVLHEGRLIDDFELYDPTLADIEVQVLAWLIQLRDGHLTKWARLPHVDGT